MSMIFQVIAAIIGVMAFAALFRAPRRYYLDCGITGGIGWLIYLLVMQQGFSTVIASLVATLALTILSRMLSVWRQAPRYDFFSYQHFYAGTGSRHLLHGVLSDYGSDWQRCGEGAGNL